MQALALRLYAPGFQRIAARSSGRGCSGASLRPCSWRVPSPRASSGRWRRAPSVKPGKTSRTSAQRAQGVGGGSFPRRRAAPDRHAGATTARWTRHISSNQRSWPRWRPRRACRRPAGPLELASRLGDGRPHAAAPQRRTLDYTQRELLSLVAHWAPGVATTTGPPPTRGWGPAHGAPAGPGSRADADIAAAFFRMFDLPPDAAPIVLNVDVPDRVLKASVQAAGASVAALCLAWRKTTATRL